MNIFRSVLSSGEPQKEPSHAETVERLIDRFETAVKVDDRRDTLRALKSLSRKCRVEVGSRGMNIFVDVIKDAESDAEMLSFALEALTVLLVGDPGDEEGSEDESLQIGERFAEIFLKQTENAEVLLGLLSEYDFNVKWPVVKVLTALLRYQPRRVQEVILANPDAVPKMMDLLSDRREVIRNDALLLLAEVVKGNGNIQKIVAFECAFERLLDIVYQEGDSIVSEDALSIIVELLRNNPSNQQLFRENSLVERLKPLVMQGAPPQGPIGGDQDDEDSVDWTAQRVANMFLVFAIIRRLVSPSNSANLVQPSQRVMLRCGLLHEMGRILMSSSCPADILAEAIATVAEIIRGNNACQETFAAMTAPSSPPRPAINVLLTAMLSADRQPFHLCTAVLYCFQSYLHGHPAGRHAVIATLLPSSFEVSADGVIVWFAASALSHCLIDSPEERRQLLQVKISTSGMDAAPVGLLEKSLDMLMQTTKFQARVAFLCFLCRWLDGSPAVVTKFLGLAARAVPYLTAEASSSQGDDMDHIIEGLCCLLLAVCVKNNENAVQGYDVTGLKQIIDRRIGCDVFLEKLSALTKNEYYIRAAQKPHLKPKGPNDLVFDHEFTRLCKSVETEVYKILKPSDAEIRMQEQIKANAQAVEQYKALIKQQDEQIAQLKADVQRITADADRCRSEVHSLQAQLQEARAAAPTNHNANSVQNGLPSDPAAATGQSSAVAAMAWESLAQQWETQAKCYVQYVEQLRNWFAQQSGCDPTEVFRAQIRDLEQQLTFGWKKYEELTGTIAQRSAVEQEQAETISRLNDVIKSLQDALAQAQAQAVALSQPQTAETSPSLGSPSPEQLSATTTTSEQQTRHEIQNLKKEQEDLLLLLADQDQRLMEYRAQLRQLGVKVESDEEAEVEA